jgi:multidrug efflux system membrane fusion protein
VDVYKLNVEYTKVTSPIDGQASRYYLTPGNLVNQDQTLLTTVVSLDPMYVYFELDEPTLLRVRNAINEGKIQRSPEGQHPLFMGLQGEEQFPHAGTVNFVNNQVNPATGSISVRGVFANPLPKDGSRLLSPGMFVRVRLPIGQPRPALLIIDRAISSDQGLKYVYVLDSKDEVEYRRVVTGPLQEDGLRVITQGLNPSDRVVVGGLQQLRARMKVRPEPVPMPSFGAPEPEPAGAPRPEPQPHDPTPAEPARK